MPQTLQSTIDPSYTKGIIKLAMSSQKGESMVWCVVEGSEDIGIYNRFFDAKTASILQAKGEDDGRGGYKNVVKIVVELIKEEPQCHIFGICDRDYTKYYANITFPDMVFLTDDRDIEIMMLNAPSVIGGLNDWDALFPQKLRESIEACRYLGYLRIYNHVLETDCTFHDNIKFSQVWDFSTQSLKNDWQDILLKKFIRFCHANVRKEGIFQFINAKHLTEESWSDVCRGHDVLDLLHLMMVKKEFSRKAIRYQMIDAYSFNDFQLTSLCKSIEQWATFNGVKILRE